MKTHTLKNKEGFFHAFEVGNTFLGRRGAVRVVRSIPGVKLLHIPKPFSWFREEVFCRFELSGHQFMIEEPWGDSSVYWVGPVKPFEKTEQIHQIQAAFEKAGPFGF